MKKITKTNFQGLRQLFPVLEKEEMRHYVGGSSDGYYYEKDYKNKFSGIASVIPCVRKRRDAPLCRWKLRWLLL